MADTHGTEASVFGEGELKVDFISSVDAWHSSRPPKPLFIAAPMAGGEYPVVLFFHGFEILNVDYKQLFGHIASHGFIVVAPQLYITPLESAEMEIRDAVKVADWISSGLKSLLPTGVNPNLHKIALAGHSRGGHTAFSIALGRDTKPSINFSALIGVDPVAGTSKSSQIKPEILDFKRGSFELDMPVMVIGSGLGEERMGLLLPPCAPKGVNHAEFYNECRPKCCYFVVKDYGHTDMLDDDALKLTKCVCKSGKTREPMRRSVGGLAVAFLRAYLEGEKGELLGIVKEPQIAPAELNPAVLREV
ncbi:Chlorophyllase-1 [Acorus calamus]|uniref:Chlorophyllase-1 n=1 Tax=Acorus calamus TaxID=4465 RepID=A0AAV9EJW9_ACOCL|nr:Chlorophyllase-1 [Acorus calamus]